MNIYLKYAGFTLLECLTIVGIIAILASLAVIYGGTWFTQQKSRVFIEQLVHDLQFARQQALIHQSYVTFCPTIDHEKCAETNNWETAYLIFLDPKGNTLLDDSATLLSLTQVPGNGILTNTRKYVQFSADGFTRSTNSTFTYNVENKVYKIIINLQGRIRVEE